MMFAFNLPPNLPNHHPVVKATGVQCDILISLLKSLCRLEKGQTEGVGIFSNSDWTVGKESNALPTPLLARKQA